MTTGRGGISFEERIGRVLLEGGFLTSQQLEKAKQLTQEKGIGLLDVILSQGMVARETLTTVLSFQLRIPIVDLRHVQVDAQAVRLMPEDYAQKHKVLPVGFDSDGSLRVATATPHDFQLSSEISSITGRQTKFVLALGGELDELIRHTYASTAAAAPKKEAPSRGESETVVGRATAIVPTAAPQAGGLLGQDVSQLPAVQAVEMITLQALKRQASDIHLVPTSDSSKVLFRLDGELQHAIALPMSLHESMISRIKVLADMDISEKRRPQDGSFSLKFGEKMVDFRVATIGTAWGEMMVIRVLDRAGGPLSLEDLGLESTSLHIWRQLLGLPYGMVLVSGPTGSGKTTTLYASVAELIKERGNIMTIEDPIEYRMEALNQIEVNRAAGVDFPTGLKSIMRLDPDVILVGEIRDAETAKTAVDAALTGHLVLASIHSNDAASSIVRLLDLGTEPYLVATAVVGALAQRLVRRLCVHCAIVSDVSATESMVYEQEMQEPASGIKITRGCNYCGQTGYAGRIGVFEVLSVSENIRKLVSSNASGQEIRAVALAEGMIPLRRAGMLLAKSGTTSVDEVMKKVFFIE